MIDQWFKQDLQEIFATYGIAVFIDESGEAEFLLSTLGNDYVIHQAHSEIEELHVKYLIEKAILSENHSLKHYDITIQVTNLLGSTIASGIGAAVYITIISALYKKNLKPGLAVLGNLSIGGAIERAINFADKVTMLSENGAKTVIVPMDNLVELANLPPTILGETDVPFYQNNQMLLHKAILLD